MGRVIGDVLAEDAQGLGQEVVGTVAQVVDPAEGRAAVGEQHIATRRVDAHGQTLQEVNGGEVVDLGGAEGVG